jgi:alpha-maltose-1-phosphate synthase
MKHRVLAGMGANSFGMALSIGIQLASLPLFLYYWDTATYGNWLILSAIPAYLSMADVGMVTAAGNKVVMAMGKGDETEANRVFQSAQLFMAVVCSGVAMLAIPTALFVPLPGVSGLDMRMALGLLSGSVLLSLFGGLYEVVFKATQRYAAGTMLGNLTRLIEWLGMMLGLVLSGTFTAVALGGLVFRLGGIALGMSLARRGNHPLHWGFAAADRKEIRSMVKPALSFMAFPLSNALSFQGITLLVGALLGPASVAIFTTYRTLSRFAVQATAVLSHALWPEFSTLFGRGDMPALQHMFRKTFLLGAAQAILLSAVLYPLAPWLLQLWTHNAIARIPSLMFCMLLYAAIGGSWHVPRVLLMATNQHARLASWSIVGGVLTVALAWMLGQVHELTGNRPNLHSPVPVPLQRAPHASCNAMKVSLSAMGKFHTFDLARELLKRNALAAIYTGYPRFKLKGEGIPQELIHTIPWTQGAYMGFPWKHKLSATALRNWENFNAAAFGYCVGRNLPDCDVYVGLSGSSLPAGARTQSRGGKYVCDRGSAHIRVQDQLLREEHALWNMPYYGIDPRAIAREEAEYAQADCITVPSGFVLQSFLDQGVDAAKMRLLPYGVNLARFHPTAIPSPERFDVLFVGGMSLRKGVQYLVQAYQKLQHPAKTLTYVGAPSPELIDMLKSRQLWPADAKVLGHVPQPELKDIMSRSHVMVLPSLEEGLAMVQAQAMACACPVIASTNTGSQDLFTHGQEGWTVPIRDVGVLADRMQHLADNPSERDAMGQRALKKVSGLGGWSDYGDRAMTIYKELAFNA